ncbi:hypothetical protein [Prescottella subtropica]|uniref:hypothetical protein n=1 Tax=Prescottella subtropica TaxID=2545757 RepID=UPI001F4F46D2|nr:hypothetical protein [Prescottella subtropica]
MTNDHAELIAELRALADVVLDRLDPILAKAQQAAGSAATGADTDGCRSCSWCPLCALAALIRGEQHDLVTLVAGQASTVLAALRETIDAHERGAGAPPDGEPTPPPPTPSSAFAPIDVTITT